MQCFKWALVLIPVILACSFSTDSVCRRSGIKGYVYLETGNRMPSPDAPLPVSKGIKTTLYIYTLTNISEVERDGVSAFYKNISTRFVKEVNTGNDGYFKLKLKPGLYSLFVRKADLYYSSQFDEKNNIHPVEVKPGQMTDVVFKVNYSAVY
jgi:hypothetical protein